MEHLVNQKESVEYDLNRFLNRNRDLSGRSVDRLSETILTPEGMKSVSTVPCVSWWTVLAEGNAISYDFTAKWESALLFLCDKWTELNCIPGLEHTNELPWIKILHRIHFVFLFQRSSLTCKYLWWIALVFQPNRGIWHCWNFLAEKRSRHLVNHWIGSHLCCHGCSWWRWAFEFFCDAPTLKIFP